MRTVDAVPAYEAKEMAVTWGWTVIGVELNLVTVAAVIVLVSALAFGFLLMRGRKR